MAKQAFQFLDAVALTNSVVTENGTYVLTSSASVSNTVGLKSMKLVIEYSNINPDFGAVPQTFDIDAVVEGRFGARWFPIAYQFTPYRNPFNGNQRIIQLQPLMSGFDAGVDDIMWVGDATRARISRQQGQLPDTEFRLCILVTERGYGGSGAFQGVTVTALGEAFDA